jgi:4-amino-4-deoxy-L-arabinose transferase-like glycosyltransferase
VPPTTANPDRHQIPILIAALFAWAVLWALLPSFLNVVPPVDNIEQRVWAASAEWGYHKHPPLPTWLYIAASSVLPDSYALTYALATLVLALGFVAYWRLARDLVGAEAATVAVLLTLCLYWFTARASYFNHNTVLVALTSLAAFHAWRASRDGRWVDWVVFGAASAAATLTKYQYGVFLLVMALLALRLGWWRRPRLLAGSALAAATWAALVAPHAWWLVQHDFLTFRYAEGTVGAALDALGRLRNLASFSAQQLRVMLGLGVALGIAAWIARAARRQPRAAVVATDTDAVRRTWVLALAFGPAAVMAVLCLVAGTRLQNHWGTSGLQFIALPIAAWFVARHGAAARRAILVGFLVAQALHVTWFVIDTQRQQRPLADGTPAYTSAAFAGLAAATWREHGSDRLDYMVGTLWLAGTAAVDHPDRPLVLIDGEPENGPWVDPARLAVCGALYIGAPAEGLADADARGSWRVVETFNRRRGEVSDVAWAVRRPREACTPTP